MNNKEKSIASDMLYILSDMMGNSFCNDWNFPIHWSEDEKATFVKEFHEWNGDPENFDVNHLVVPDFGVAAFLSSKMLDDEDNQD